ncbi:13-hydroxylupanine O-tigloyltransferase-like [Glycine max]|uniref:13-hydroxylupanine O-tigloyltransferase-like n=1 Tax=Glycine max TaxID=3847 RepID=UPI0007193B75|nr:13-hydroxylupanine O-tigloyltransferase-like [Glycine max]|eukprot:XP_014617184.1 13-hydroxylupanine O-tigloyltransferase-like [Glycine max]
MATTVQDIVLLKLSQSGCQGKRKKLENLNFTPQLWVQTGDKPIEKKRWSETYNFVYESLKLCQHIHLSSLLPIQHKLVLQTSSLDFTVRRNPPELVAPANPTPRELKLLSGIDDQHGLRYQLPFVQFYRYQPAMAGKDPVQVIRKALAKTLVFYYRFAGRLREGPNGKLTVDCDEEGVLFIEADADVAIEQFGDNFMPPFPFFDEILYNVPGSDGIIECPLVLIQLGKQLAYKLNVYEGQVTRLKCGGFTLGFALELVKKAKNEANEEYVHSVADLMATKERSCYPRLGSFSVSDLTKAGIIDVNFGWGKALYI